MNDNHHYITITVSPIVGTNVKTRDDEPIGEISGVVLDTRTGNAPYVVLGLNAKNITAHRKYIMLSWESIHSNAHQPQEFILDIDKNKLENLPGFYSECTQGCTQYALEKAQAKNISVGSPNQRTGFLPEHKLNELHGAFQ